MEDNQEGSRGWWRFFDGSASVSASMLVAVLLSRCVLCENLPVLGLLKTLANEESGVIIAATIMLFPTTLHAMYGGAQLIFAAKEAVERRAKERLKKQREEGRKEGVAEGRKEGVAEGRKQVRGELEKRGMLTPELAEIFEEEHEA